MRIAFHDGSIHEGARVSFLSICDHIDRARVLPGIIRGAAPLAAGGETATTPAAQAG